MKLSDVVAQAEESLRDIRNELADHNYWGGPDPSPERTAAMIEKSITMKEMIALFKTVTEI